MDLSQAQTVVKGLKLTVPGVRKICDDFRLCYYCKLSHPGKMARDCPNKSKDRATNLCSAEIYEDLVGDQQSIDGGIAIDSGKV